MTPAGASPPVPGPRTVIIVDDSMSARDILQLMLERLGYSVEAFAGSTSALRRLDREPLPEILLVDWNMPVMDGLTMIRMIRQHPVWRGMRIMMVTAEASRDHVTRALAAGADEYLAKPYTLDMLRGKMKALEARRRP